LAYPARSLRPFVVGPLCNGLENYKILVRAPQAGVWRGWARPGNLPLIPRTAAAV